MMTRPTPCEEGDFFFDVDLAKWVTSVLNMLIAVVGKESLLGLILRQTKTEITSLVRDEQATPIQQHEQWFGNN